MDDSPSASKISAVPLSRFQSEVLRTIAAQRSLGSYIALAPNFPLVDEVALGDAIIPKSHFLPTPATTHSRN